MQRESTEKRNYWILLAIAIVAGLGFLVWGQFNTASTIFDLGFYRRNAYEVMTSAEGVKLEGEDRTLYDSMIGEGSYWAQGKPRKQGSWETSTAASWFGEKARLRLSYDFYTQNSDRTVVLLHGFEQTSEDVLYWASFWWDRGWDVLIPQQRSYGEADAGQVVVTYGVYEQFDLYDLILAAGLDRDTLVLQGRGAGAAAAILLAANKDLADAGVDGIVAESVYANMEADAETLVKQLFNLGNPLLKRFLNYRIRTGLGFLPESVDLTAAAADCTIPALFICASDDTFLDPRDTLLVCGAWAGEARLAELTGGHRLIWGKSKPEYRQALGEFAEIVE